MAVACRSPEAGLIAAFPLSPPAHLRQQSPTMTAGRQPSEFKLFGFIAFVETDNAELISYSILTVAVLLIIYFAVFVDQDAKPISSEETPAPSAVSLPTAPAPAPAPVVHSSPEKAAKVVIVRSGWNYGLTGCFQISCKVSY